MAAALTFGEIRQGATSWIRSDLQRTLRVGAISFAVAWLVNFVVITNWGAALGNVIGAATDGTETSGAAYIAIMSLVITSLVVYGMEAGWSDLRRSFTALPRAVARMFREHGIRMWSVVLWGAAVSLLTSGALDPTLSAALGLGVLAFAPTAVTGIIGRLITGIWSWLIGFFAPKNKPRTPGLGGQLVGVVGAGAGFLVASQATETAFQLIAAAALAALSYLVLTNSTSRAATTSAWVLMGLAFWVGGEAVAAASPCCGEGGHHPIDPGMKAAGLSVIAGLAGGVGGMIGAGVGSVLAAHPQDPGMWDDEEPGTGPILTSDPIPDGPTQQASFLLRGDAAREAIAAFEKAGTQGQGVEVPVPDDAAQGLVGARGRITAIGPLVEADDGSISVSVEVTAYAPPAVAVDSGIAGTLDGSPPPPPSADVAAGTAPDTGDAAPDHTAVEPMPDLGEVIEDTEVPERTAPRREPPDGSDPGAYAAWLADAAAGNLPPDDLAALQALIRGERAEVTLSGAFTGVWAALQTEGRTDGVALCLPTRDRVLLRLRGGAVEARPESSLGTLTGAGSAGLPSARDMAAALDRPLDGFNAAITATGRQIGSLSRNPDRSITIRTVKSE